MNKTSLRNFMRVAACLLCLLWGGCARAGTDSGGETPGNPNPKPDESTISLDEFRTFLDDRISACEYCRKLSVDGSCFEMVCLGSNSCRLEKSDIPFLSVDKNGLWCVDGVTTGIPAGDKVIHGACPQIQVTGSGNLEVNGADLGVAAGNSIRCIIDARKLIFVGFPDETVALGSEIYGTYNPVLPVGKDEIRVLFIGNSFTEDATAHLPGILAAAGVQNVRMTRVYHGGYTLPEYNENFATPNTCARRDCSIGDAQWSGDNTLDSSLEEILVSDTWDIVTLQEHTGNRAGWSWPGVLQEAIGGLVDKIYSAQPKHRPTILYLMAQTYAHDSYVLSTYFNNDRSEMFSTVTGVVQQILSETCVDLVIPSGTMLENLRTTSVNVSNGLELTRDSYHMDYGISRYGAACTVFESIIAPCTGKTLDGNTYRYAQSSTESGKYSTPVTDTNAPVAIKAAREACNKPFEVTDLSDL